MSNAKIIAGLSAKGTEPVARALATARAEGTLLDVAASVSGKAQRMGLVARVAQGIAMVDYITAETAVNGKCSDAKAGKYAGFRQGGERHGKTIGHAYLLAGDANLETVIRLAATTRSTGAQFKAEKDYVLSAAAGDVTFDVATLVALMDAADDAKNAKAEPRDSLAKAMSTLDTLAKIVASNDGTITGDESRIVDHITATIASLQSAASVALADVA